MRRPQPPDRPAAAAGATVRQRRRRPPAALGPGCDPRRQLLEVRKPYFLEVRKPHLLEVYLAQRPACAVTKNLAACKRRQHVSMGCHHTLCRFQHQAAPGLAGQVEPDRPHWFAIWHMICSMMTTCKNIFDCFFTQNNVKLTQLFIFLCYLFDFIFIIACL
jgi:hypothetical protein